MKKVILISLISVIGSMALADQCAYIPRVQALKAIKLLMKAQRIQSLCELCGEVTPQDMPAESIGVRKVEVQGNLEVVVDGRGIDLAYTYVNGVNLAKLVACPTDGVSPTLK